ncbi:site-specific DNA-methyltransferase [Flavobacterium polysaccharolyticum]|uniref:site-specific DNA-methyltransferase (adenine-specific) n=1 Tax=Flavobacterium polysaccharolyticum TaxID=3133148 RepID=A0ABU9NR62_9FLAO
MPTLNWIGKEKVVNHHLEVPFKVLEHSYGFQNGEITEKESSSGNKIIHGDNLEALKALLPEYENRINCIYIDPPYNTGEEKWKYNDNVNHPKIKKWLNDFVGKEGEDLSRHDKWLCMIYPRLKLLQKLLSDEGVIFISIDDHEVHNLISITNEIFGVQNKVALLSWEKKKKGSHLNNWITNVKEYVIVYCKNKAHFKGLIGQVVNHKETYPCINPGNAIGSRIIPKGVKSTFREKNHILPKGSIISAGNMSLELESELELENGFLKNDVTIKSEWRYGQDKINEFAKSNELYFTRDLYLRREVTEPRSKRLKDWLPRVDNEYLLELKNELINEYEKEVIDNDLIDEIKDQINKIEVSTHKNFDTENLNASGWGSNEDGDEENRKIFNKKVFDFPKPSKLISKLICSFRDKDAIILDSFAGSGTTAHAVLNLNEQDGGNRKFILIEMEDYAETITSERVKRVINGYADIAGTGGSFDFYKLDQSLFKEDGNLNETVDIKKIRSYIYYTETKTVIDNQNHIDNKYFLSKYNDTAYYFYYKPETPNESTTLNHEFLATMKTKAEQYIIYADNVSLDESFMKTHNIIFKKIPRGITRF